MKITFIRIVQQALQRQLELLEIFWTPIVIILEGYLAKTLLEKLTGHLLKHVFVFSKNRFAVPGIYLLMKVYCLVYKNVPKKRLKEFYEYMSSACRYMN